MVEKMADLTDNEVADITATMSVAPNNAAGGVARGPVARGPVVVAALAVLAVLVGFKVLGRGGATENSQALRVAAVAVAFAASVVLAARGAVTYKDNTPPVPIASRFGK